MKSALLFIGFALAVIVVLFILSSWRAIPFIPQDLFHQGTTNNSACLTCHTPGRQAPLRESHTPDEDCFSCHLHKVR